MKEFSCLHLYNKKCLGVGCHSFGSLCCYYCKDEGCPRSGKCCVRHKASTKEAESK